MSKVLLKTTTKLLPTINHKPIPARLYSIFHPNMAPKRKAIAPNAASAIHHTDPSGSKPNDRSAQAASKKQKLSSPPPLHDTTVLPNAKYYKEISTARCKAYNDGTLPKPIDLLERKVADTEKARAKIEVGKGVFHWFKRDLRTRDNRGLTRAADLAKKNGVPLICLYLISPEDLEAHLASKARVDFDLRTLAVLKGDLDKVDVPFVIDVVDKREKVPAYILELCKKLGVRHIFTNIEYEVDELRRETGLISTALEAGIAFTTVHDDIVVSPGSLKTGTGKQYAVYSPWFRSWIKYVHADPSLLEPSDPPSKNPKNTRKDFATLFESKVPDTPSQFKLSKEESTRFSALFPAGENAALERLKKFVLAPINGYASNRNLPAANATSCLSVHHSSGTLSPRTSVRMARDANSTQRLDGGSQGAQTWISEVAWRDFYKHVLAAWPYVCMGKPFKYEYAHIRWEYNEEHFRAWCEGKTGFPIVDAAMRQLTGTGYVHNRCRMIVASFLSKDLLLDWRMGEAYFHSHLIDCDFASNNGGWGFSASVGVDPQPYFRIFNPLLQSEKFDADGEYIRKWVPELKGIKGKAIHDPYSRGAGAEASKNGYPKPIVDHKACRERALERYKEAAGRTTA